ncbi:hypothetical protein QTN47_27605 [Danxiaibacter flavus]|uniref:Lipocalin-like domain-containing protein n=1 Tax=Danxiaibacter flavus TaxID=3049108 RepID=A0ABV3ZN35_9BACT|nr:hypothetical protein QNM32_27605 [Chitinophagaceae bacterium DXS]
MTEAEKSNSIIGSWELRSTVGSMPLKTFPPNNGHVIQFTNDSYTVFDSGQAKEKGNYASTPDSSVEANVCLVIKEGQFTNRIILSASSNPYKIFFNLEGNQLTFLSGCFALDAGNQTVYERVGEDR